MTYGLYLAYNRHYRFAKTAQGWAEVFWAILIGIGLAVFLSERAGRRGGDILVNGIVAPLVFIAVWLLTANFLFPIFALWSARRRGSYTNDAVIYIDPDHVWTTDATTELKMAWQGIECVMASKKYIFIYFNKSAAFCVPRTAFRDSGDSFFNRANTYFIASRQKSD